MQKLKIQTIAKRIVVKSFFISHFYNIVKFIVIVCLHFYCHLIYIIWTITCHGELLFCNLRQLCKIIKKDCHSLKMSTFQREAQPNAKTKSLTNHHQVYSLHSLSWVELILINRCISQSMEWKWRYWLG